MIGLDICMVESIVAVHALVVALKMPSVGDVKGTRPWRRLVIVLITGFLSVLKMNELRNELGQRHVAILRD